MTETLQEYVSDAIDELRDWMKDHPDEEADDIISELADSNTPVYTSTILDLAASNWEIGNVESGIGPAFDGAPTPANIAASNIYTHLLQKMHEWANALQECELCSGEGEVYDECTECFGTGRENDVDETICDLCQSMGEVPTECTECDGRGKVEA